MTFPNARAVPPLRASEFNLTYLQRVVWEPKGACTLNNIVMGFDTHVYPPVVECIYSYVKTVCIINRNPHLGCRGQAWGDFFAKALGDVKHRSRPFLEPICRFNLSNAGGVSDRATLWCAHWGCLRDKKITRNLTAGLISVPAL